MTKKELADLASAYWPLWDIPKQEYIPDQKSKAALRTGVTIVLLKELWTEMDRQVELWGDQSYPDGLMAPGGLAEKARELCEDAVKAGTLTWWDILYEEVAEVQDATDEDNLLEELNQVAAVCLSWRRDILNRSNKKE